MLQRKIGPRNIPTLSDEDLQNMIVRMKDEDPHCGQPYISGEIRALGFYVPRSRVRKQLRIVDPVGTVRRRRVITRRRRYRVKGPNYIWLVSIFLFLPLVIFKTAKTQQI